MTRRLVSPRASFNSGSTSLKQAHPELATQWHPTKNGDLTPDDVTSRSGRKAWWLGRCGHEWDARIADRSGGRGCPICSGDRVVAGVNDLATTRPDLAAQWHPTKNGDLGPTDLVKGSNRKVWWLDEYGHEWEAMVGGRDSGGGCPYCSGRRVLAGYNDLATEMPELAAQWHPTKNGDLTPQQVRPGSHSKAWWVDEHGHEWQAQIKSRSNGVGCPVCAGLQVLAGYNDLATTHPDIAAQWHPTKNGDLTPRDVTAGKGSKAWWFGGCGHEWDASIANRTGKRRDGCPVCRGIRVSTGYNDLATTHPDLAAEWHPTRNGDLTPQDVSAGSHDKVWWQDDLGHEWQSVLKRRGSGAGCPFCSGHRVWPGYNDLATTHPEVSAEWHPTRNGKLAPRDVSAGSHVKAWWIGSCGHEWDVDIAGRAAGDGCPVCKGFRIAVGSNDLATTRPDLADQWHPTRNGDLTANDVVAGSNRKVWWLDEQGHEWQAVVSSRSQGNGCAVCSGRQVLPGFNDLATTRPDLAAEWHPTKNGDLIPDMVSAGTSKKFWWIGSCGHEWDSSPAHRSNRGQGCPYCLNKRVLVGHNDLATTRPWLVSEWHPTKNGDLTPRDVTYGSSRKVWWRGVCGHEWQAEIARRSSGSGCAACAVLPTSQIESDLFDALVALYPDAEHDHSIQTPRGYRSFARCDIALTHAKVAIEYDGSYWHAKRSRQDTDKTTAILREGWDVVRVRENDLHSLDIDHPGYAEVRWRYDKDGARELAALVAEAIGSMRTVS